jgi:hypothetical protein
MRVLYNFSCECYTPNKIIFLQRGTSDCFFTECNTYLLFIYRNVSQLCLQKNPQQRHPRYIMDIKISSEMKDNRKRHYLRRCYTLRLVFSNWLSKTLYFGLFPKLNMPFIMYFMNNMYNVSTTMIIWSKIYYDGRKKCK